MRRAFTVEFGLCVDAERTCEVGPDPDDGAEAPTSYLRPNIKTIKSVSASPFFKMTVGKVASDNPQPRRTSTLPERHVTSHRRTEKTLNLLCYSKKTLPNLKTSQSPPYLQTPHLPWVHQSLRPTSSIGGCATCLVGGDAFGDSSTARTTDVAPPYEKQNATFD